MSGTSATLERTMLEAGGWVACRIPYDANQADVECLADSRPRPGNVRLALNRRRAYLLGELHDVDGQLTIAEAEARLFDPTAWTTRAAELEVPSVEVASVLAETSADWSPAQDSSDRWQAVVSQSEIYRHELTAALVPHGVDVRGKLVDWDGELSGVSRAAIVLFLTAAHGRIRFARFILHDRGVSVASFAAADRLHVELPDSVSAVTIAGGLVQREVNALVHEPLARTYLEVNKSILL